jgi:hypothetical protein
MREGIKRERKRKENKWLIILGYLIMFLAVSKPGWQQLPDPVLICYEI